MANVTIGPAIFFDGATGERHEVAVELTATGLRVSDITGTILADWPYRDLESMSAPDRLLRIGRRNNPVPARIEVTDRALMAAIDDKVDGIDRTGTTARRQRRGVIVWTMAATVSLVLVAWFGIPAIADKLAPVIPVSIEKRIGAAVEMQTRGMLDTQNAGARFECGRSGPERAGQAAFDKLMRRLQAQANLSLPVKAQVVRNDSANAIALPGGTVYVFQGLIAKAQSPDEVAGVIAHELGHLAHRDGTRSVLQGAGLSFLFGMVLGDFFGGGALVLAARTLLQSSYTRDVETAADAYAVDLMNAIGANARALGTILTRIGGATEPGMKILMDHPDTRLRVSVINSRAKGAAGVPLLDAGEWAALRKICG
jgi:Zn-dependent protease with chaperone function